MARSREAMRRAAKGWKSRNPQKVAAEKRAYNSKNREKVRAQQHNYRGMPIPTRQRPAVCECCGKIDPTGVVCLDHDHVTNVFRGWLCKRCNTAIGLLGDTLYGVLCAVDYLVSK